ncbi:hypothetical protein DMUE_5365 [Dictyocoela muelleri]|nr:hypothetical protein DMUE_5365 [Dictyocoela muelleri]
MRLKVYKENENEYSIYRCICTSCRKRKTAYKSNLKINKILKLIYLIMAGSSYCQLFLFSGISNSTIDIMKKKIFNCYRIYLNNKPVYLGGLGIKVEVDETFISRSGIIKNPSSTDDAKKDTVWILDIMIVHQRKKIS